MKRFRLLAVLGALALCTATVVWGDYNVLDKYTHYQNATNGARTNSTGDLRVDDMSRDRNNWRIYPNVINNFLITGATGMSDSCQAQDTHDIRKLTLVIYGTPDSLSTVVRIAVQIRGHYNTATDSGSAYPWYRWPTRATANGTTDVDSLGHMFLGSYAVAQVTTANAPFAGATGMWPGEFMVKFSVANNDSTAAGNGKYGGYPKGMWIPLVDAVGVPFQAPYTSVRVRILNGVRSRFKLRADLVGQSQ